MPLHPYRRPQFALTYAKRVTADDDDHRSHHRQTPRKHQRASGEALPRAPSREPAFVHTVVVPETNIESAISRHLLRVEDRANAWLAIQGCYAAQLSDAALDWLINGGVITHEQRGDAAAILRNISDWLERAG
jgi:hypothetical protein